ncbi:uncharacterized protein G2W53_008198 [Senna tora]|uniref:HAT C-terminal dimerisation domain-containing protein n=1 Tax=Senna tora TaxID=362788 RepID=A0A835CFL3_9FABA|nr:uncharacterized protein G2W53_008198 [Senna tora]
MADKVLVNSPEEDMRRNLALQKLKQSVSLWIKKSAWNCRLPKCEISITSATRSSRRQEQSKEEPTRRSNKIKSGMDPSNASNANASTPSSGQQSITDSSTLTYKGGGINRMKQHLAGVTGQITSCKKVPHDVRHQMLESLKNVQQKKQTEELNEAYDDQQEAEESPQPSKRVAFAQASEAIYKAKMAIAKWFYDACIPFNAINSPYFQEAVDAVAAIGLRFKGPSYHELRVNLLGDWVTFLKSVDASDLVKDAQMLFNLFSEVIEWVGPSNVVHIVTDNAANFVAAGVTSRASKVTIFVYNHMTFLAWLRKREGWKEIVRPGVTRFATTFITSKSIHGHKHHLQALVTHDHFVKHRLAKTAAGKTFSDIVLDNKFWNDCLIDVKIVAPIVHLLRIVDADEKPSMGYIYEGMHKAKKAIKEMFKGKKQMYKPYTDIIKARWHKHFRCDLHAAAYYFNPVFFYDEKFVEKNNITQAVLRLLEIRSICNDLAKGIQEMQVYYDRKGSFGRESARKVTRTIRPDQWWRLYGGSAPFLQKIAIRVLSQTASSSGCERNWSFFERVHTKKRNRLEHQRLSDHIFITYNLRLANSPKSDIDALCFAPFFTSIVEDFLLSLHEMLERRPEVYNIHCVKSAEVPLMRFKFDEIFVDLPLAQINVVYVPENVDILKPFFMMNIDDPS